MGRACTTNGEMNACSILVRKPEGKRPLGRARSRRVDNIKMHLREEVWSGMEWIDLAQDRDQWRGFVNTIMDFRVPLIARKFLSSYAIGVFSRRAQLHEVNSVSS
jgi:hypothetical protein